MVIKKAAVSVVALIASASMAGAADLEGPSYVGSLKDGFVAPAYNWTGLYVGAHAGYGWGEHDGTGVYTGTPNCEDSCDKFHGGFDLDGAFGGGQLGFNLQRGSFVFGIEGDGSWANIDGSGSFGVDEAPKNGVADYTWNLKTDVEWLASLRGRIGFLISPSLLIYGTGGVAWAGLESHQQVICHAEQCLNGNNPTTVLSSSSETAVGWVAGIGGEWMFAPNWSLRGEWLHYDFGDVDTNFKGTAYPNGDPQAPIPNYTNDSFPGDIVIDTVRIGVNYKFGN